MAQAKKEEAQYAPPASQVDAEERRANDNKSSKVLTTAEVYEPDEEDEGRDYGDVDRTGYIGTNPEYQTYSSETEKPGVGDGVDDEIAEDFLDAKDMEAATGDNSTTDDSATEADGEDKSNLPKKSSSSASSGNKG